MRNLIFLVPAALFLMQANVSAQIFRNGTLYSSFAENYVGSEEKSFEESSSAKYDAGIGLNFSHGSMMLVSGINSLRLSDADSADFAEIQKIRYGADVRINPAKVPVSVSLLAGTLKFSQGISRLKNPVFSVPSPLHLPYSFGCGINPSLPDFSSGVSPFAAAVTVAPSSRNLMFPSFQAGVTENMDMYINLSRKFSSAIVPGASFSLTLARTSLDSAESTSWFLKEKFCQQDSLLSSGIESNFTFPHVRVGMGIGVHENPFGMPLLWFRLHNGFLIEGFSFNADCFYGEKDLVLAEGNLLKTYGQISLNPQYSFSARRCNFSLGILANANFKQVPQNDLILYNEYNGKFSFSFYKRGFSSDLNCSAFYSCLDESWEYSASVRAKKSFESLRLNSSFGMKRAGQDPVECSFSQSLAPVKSALSLVSLSGTFGGGGFRVNSAVSFAGKSKRFKWNVKNAVCIGMNY